MNVRDRISYSKKQTSSDKAKNVLRVLGRIFNPFNDAVVGFFTYDIIKMVALIEFPTIEQKLLKITGYLFLSSGTACALMSIFFELYSSMKLSGQSDFSIGDSDFNHVRKIAMYLQNLEDNEELLEKINNIDLFVHDLSSNSQVLGIKDVLSDLDVCYRYNQKRKLVDIISVGISGIVPVLVLLALVCVSIEICKPKSDLLPDNEVLGSLWTTLGIIGSIFLSKLFINHVESKWYQYENKWNELSYNRQRIMVGIRNFIEIAYDLTVGFISIYFIYKLPNCLFIPKGSFLCRDISQTPKHASVLGSISYLIPIAILYTIAQHLPRHIKIFGSTNGVKNIKRYSQAIVNGSRIGSILMLTLMILRNVIENILFQNNENRDTSITNAFFAILSIISTITIIANNILNYQEPDHRKISITHHRDNYSSRWQCCFWKKNERDTINHMNNDQETIRLNRQGDHSAEMEVKQHSHVLQ